MRPGTQLFEISWFQDDVRKNCPIKLGLDATRDVSCLQTIDEAIMLAMDPPITSTIGSLPGRLANSSRYDRQDNSRHEKALVSMSAGNNTTVGTMVCDVNGMQGTVTLMRLISGSRCFGKASETPLEQATPTMHLCPPTTPKCSINCLER